MRIITIGYKPLLVCASFLWRADRFLFAAGEIFIIERFYVEARSSQYQYAVGHVTMMLK